MDQVLARAEREGEGPWALPAGWAWAEISDLALGGHGSVDPSRTPTEPFILYSVPAFEAGEPEYVRGSQVQSNKQFVYPNALLVCKINPRINRVWRVEAHGTDDGKIIASTEWVVIRPHALIDPDYLRLYLSTERVRQYLSANVSGVGGSLMRVNAAVVAAIKFPLPPLPEQRRIVARVDALFTEIAEGEAALDAARKGLATFRRALLKAAVTGELTKDWREKTPVAETGHNLLARIRAERAVEGQGKGRGKRAAAAPPLDTSALPTLPEGWAWGSVRSVAEVMGGLTKNPDREKMVGRAKYLRVANVQAGRLDLADMKEIGVTADDRQRASLQPGDLLVVEGNGSIDQIGRCALWDGEIADCVHQNHIIKVRFGEPQMSRWCFKWLLSPHGRQEIEQVAASTSGLHTLSISKIEALPVPIPPPAEAAEILRRVSEALAAAADTQAMLEAEAADAARLKQSILKAAFEGRLVPQDPADEPASVALARLKAAPSPVTAARRGRRKS